MFVAPRRSEIQPHVLFAIFDVIQQQDFMNPAQEGGNTPRKREILPKAGRLAHLQSHTH